MNSLPFAMKAARKEGSTVAPSGQRLKRRQKSPPDRQKFFGHINPLAFSAQSADQSLSFRRCDLHHTSRSSDSAKSPPDPDSGGPL
jgi:hypothetical protein